jgi:hypothetical protein
MQPAMPETSLSACHGSLTASTMQTAMDYLRICSLQNMYTHSWSPARLLGSPRSRTGTKNAHSQIMCS